MNIFKEKFKAIFKRRPRLSLIILSATIIFLTITTVAIGCQVGALISDYKWPSVAKHGYVYGGAACAVAAKGAFSYTIYKDESVVGDKAFCCTQNGCRELEIKNDYGPFPKCAAGSDPLKSVACQCKRLAGLDNHSGISYSGIPNPAGCN